MNKKALVLLSSGLDSVIATAIAMKEGYEVELALFSIMGKELMKKRKSMFKNYQNIGDWNIIKLIYLGIKSFVGKKDL